MFGWVVSVSRSVFLGWAGTGADLMSSAPGGSQPAAEDNEEGVVATPTEGGAERDLMYATNVTVARMFTARESATRAYKPYTSLVGGVAVERLWDLRVVGGFGFATFLAKLDFGVSVVFIPTRYCDLVGGGVGWDE